MRLLLLFTLFLFTQYSWAQEPCATHSRWEQQLQQHPETGLKRAILEHATQQWTQGKHKTSNSIITIPVVFHVVYKNINENISDAQIMSQLAVLNEDFRRLNIDTINTFSDFEPFAADCQIEFCLAKRTPDHLPTSGITRTSTTKQSFSINSNHIYYDSLGGKDIWDHEQYLNIYVCDLASVLGFASYPGALPAVDGVVIDFENFGNMGTAQAPYNKGRTVTHEVGHWLNLIHIWGDSFCGDDFVSDTPEQEQANYGCPAHPSTSCTNSGDMFQNFMDYTNDGCMNMFTLGQKTRMHAAIYNYRSELLTSLGCQEPVEDIGVSNILSPSIDENVCGEEVLVKAEVTNYSPISINTFRLSVDIDGVVYDSTINSTLISGQSSVINLGYFTVAPGTHQLKAYTSYPNDAVDIDNSNDSLSIFFDNSPGAPINISVMTDNYGEEVSWTLSTESGTVLHADSNLTSNQLNSRELCLEEDSCYIFTIYDEYSDGICCDFGNGYFSLNGIVQSGSYQDAVSINLCDLSELNEEELTYNSLLFPNPNEGHFYVQSTELIKELRIYNQLGQLLLTEQPMQQKYAVQLSQWQGGLYLVELITEQHEPKVHKMILHP
jgi:hypothetical protein